MRRMRIGRQKYIAEIYITKEGKEHLVQPSGK
jgi:hypothetical protein